MVQLKEGVPTGWAELGAVAVEEIASPTEKVVQVRIEYHEPTEWEGSVTVIRNLVSSSSASGPNPTAGKPTRVVSETSAGMWEGILRIDNLRLNEKGIGSGEYHYTVTGEGQHQTVTKHLTWCEDSGSARVFTSNLDTAYNAQGEEYGSASVEILANPVGTPRYGINVHALGAGNSALGRFLHVTARQEHKWQDCDGSHSSSDYIEMAPDEAVLHHLIFPETIWMRNWPTFDPDASRYSDSVQWTENISNGVHRYTLLTVVEWDLKRIYK